MSNTNEKEAIGKKALKKDRIIDLFWPDNIGYKWCSSVKMQKAGVDFTVYMPDGTERYVDLKVGIGPDYYMHKNDYNSEASYVSKPGIAVEILQNGVFTNCSYKMTDYMLYYTEDGYGRRWYLYSYEDIKALSVQYAKYRTMMDGARIWPKDKKYAVQVSFNKTGHYIKAEYDEMPVLGCFEEEYKNEPK